MCNQERLAHVTSAGDSLLQLHSIRSSTMPNGFENVALACREFVAIIEAIRIQRQREAKQRPRPDLQRFSQEELCDLGYGAYKDILKSKVRYPPRKAIVTRIADYLEATPQQRNALLLAAKCAPDQINRIISISRGGITPQPMMHLD
jgi:hypothetical protein